MAPSHRRQILPRRDIREGKVETGVHAAGIGAVAIVVRQPKAREGSQDALRAMLAAAKGLPDLLAARRKVLEARWRGQMGAAAEGSGLTVTRMPAACRSGVT